MTVSERGDRVVQIDSAGRATLRGPKGFAAELGRLEKRNSNAPLKAFFSRDGSLFCTTGDLGTARVFRADTGQPLFGLPTSVYGGAFSPEGGQLAVFGQDRIIRVWDVRHGLELWQLRGHLSSITQVAYRPDGRLIASASREGVIKIWSAQIEGRVLCEEAITTSSGISPDGKWLATGPAGLACGCMKPEPDGWSGDDPQGPNLSWRRALARTVACSTLQARTGA